MSELSKKIGEMEYDGLITGLQPPAVVGGGVIAKGAAAVTYKRGTIFAKSTATGKLFILGTAAGENDTLTPDCILCEDTEVGTASDQSVTVYIGGCVSLDKCAVAEGYTVTEADKDKLRERGIIFRSASAAN